ncbi:DUF5337 domain-containing protein [Cognatishimia activa]|uniref:Uncharacterized protein n=1 Tax=Cognatishimia activa TaxID=1715691 RepID=A0A0P1IPI3_9RHOB|nr:DUF5337 domain-containing protein [Cognatishimia activa]MEE2944987.1 DUF5337 domain-containing protein [Pseudomonadota bacterium]CUJ21837.1 hypothetical protein TA5113_02683 [Cognatishimia activa]CUK25450.1 hypothetical protein TA5114_01249 [Cognatishimia activa]
MTSSDLDQQLARKGRMVSLVIAGTLILWMLIQVVSNLLGLPGRYAFLFDFAAMAALLWALINGLQLWRARRDSQG